MVNEEAWDLDEDRLLAAWEAVDRQALGLLESMLAEGLEAAAPEAEVERAAEQIRAGVEAGGWPFDFFVNSLGWKAPPAFAADEVLLDAVASTISPLEDPGIEAEQQAAIGALTHADWLAIVVGLVREGVGAELTAAGIVAAFASLDEIEDDSEEPAEPEEFELAVEVLKPLWRAAGVLDEDDRLTEVGRWLLPQALSLVWSHPDEEGQPGTRLAEEHAARAMALLAERPRTFDELADVLVAEGVDTDEDEVARSLIWRLEVFGFDDDVYVHLPTLAGGVVLTHRLTEQERELGLLATGLDLELFGLIAMDGHPFAGGGELEAVHAKPGVSVPEGALGGLRGPEGWLDGYAAGDLLGLRYDEQAIALAPVELGAPDDKQVETVAEVAREVTRRNAEIGDPMLPGVPSYEIVLEGTRMHPELFRSPLPPLSELLAGVSGIEIEHESIGVPGTNWHAAPDWLTDEERLAYDEWKHVLRDHRISGTLPEPEAAAALARKLTGRMLALAAVDMTLEPNREPVVEAMAALVDGPAAAVALYLRARAAEGRGDGPAWVTLLDEAIAADPTLEDPTAEAGDLRALTGDAKAAHRLYGLAGFDTGADEMRELRRFLEPASGEVGRNHPCPCGSGKKYKLCHGREARHPLPDRAAWLWSKVNLFARRDLNREVLLDWAELLAGPEPDVAPELVEEPLTVWFALFDGGVLQRLLDLHGGLLPDDERDLVESWVTAKTRLLEVTEASATKRITARDLSEDESLSFRDPIGRGLQPGDVLLCRLLEDGSGQPALLHPPIPVPAEIQGAMAEVLRKQASAREIAVLLSVAMVEPDLGDF